MFPKRYDSITPPGTPPLPPRRQGPTPSVHGCAHQAAPLHRVQSDSQLSNGYQHPYQQQPYPAHPQQPHSHRQSYVQQSQQPRSHRQSYSQQSQYAIPHQPVTYHAPQAPVYSSSHQPGFQASSAAHPSHAGTYAAPTQSEGKPAGPRPLPTAHPRPQPEAKEYTQDDIDRMRMSQENRHKMVNKASDLYMKGQENYERYQAKKELINTVVDKVHENLPGPLDGVKKVMKGLETVANIHPLVGGVVGVFKVIVQMEMQRRENDAKIVGLLDIMADMLSILTDLKEINDRRQIEAVLENIKQNIKDCGACVDKYVTDKSIIMKLFKASSYKEKFLAFGITFTTRKQELSLALQVNAALALNAMAANMSLQTSKIDRLADLLQQPPQSRKEKEALDYIQTHGGFDNVANNKKLLEDLAKKVNESIDAAFIRDLKMPLEQTLSEHKKMFALKLDAQTKELQKSIASSTNYIVSQIHSGPHDRLHHADMKAVWKEMGWKGHAKGRQLAYALADYYEQIFLEHYRNHSQHHPDMWTLEYMSVAYIPSILEAIDNDGSGFVTIKELNAFTDEIPSGWTLPQWIAYAADGISNDIVIYSHRVKEHFRQMQKHFQSVSKKNRDKCGSYMTALTEHLKRIDPVGDLEDYENGGGDEPLHALVRQRRVDVELTVKKNLELVNYRIDDEGGVAAVVAGKDKLDQRLLILLHLILERHDKIIKAAGSKRSISEAEFDDMTDTLESIWDAIRNRINNLKMSWNQQRLVVADHFGSYLHGIYYDWYMAEDENESEEEEEEESDDDDASDTSDLSLDYDDEEEAEDDEEEDANEPEEDDGEAVPGTVDTDLAKDVRRDIQALERRMVKMEDMLEKVLRLLSAPSGGYHPGVSHASYNAAPYHGGPYAGAPYSGPYNGSNHGGERVYR